MESTNHSLFIGLGLQVKNLMKVCILNILLERSELKNFFNDQITPSSFYLQMLFIIFSLAMQKLLES